MNAQPIRVSDPLENHLLAALPAAEWRRLQLHLEPIDLPSGKVLIQSGRPPAHLVFPTTAIVSLLCTTQDGLTAEIAVVGNDGAVGISLVMGAAATSPGEAVVQSAGHGYRLSAHVAQEETKRFGPAFGILLRYTEAMMAQVAQTAICNRYHSIDQQLCRRLLLGLDRLRTDDLAMTQERVATLLGVRRESVTAAALKLQEAGVIRYHRGLISVMDRPSLEKRTCECYAMAKKEQDRLLPIPRLAGRLGRAAASFATA